MIKILATASLVAVAGLAHAEASRSPVCDQLGRRLASLTETIGSTAMARKYSQAIASQRMNMRLLGRQLRHSGCSSDSVLVIGTPSADCGDLEAKMQRMERNLEILEEKRQSVLSGETTGLERQRLNQAYEANGCNTTAVVYSEPEEVREASPLMPREAYETLRIPRDGIDYSGSQFVDLGGASTNGSFRTMCVRSCDGGYFPVSSHASSGDFRRDAQVCSMMCPGVETELYYHSLQGESSDMRSASTGRLYRDMPNAFRFRLNGEASSKQCGCNFSLYYKEMLKREAMIKDPESRDIKESAIRWVRPELRGGLETEAVTDPKKSEADSRPYRPEKRIRVIGPRFLPDDTALDLAGRNDEGLDRTKTPKAPDTSDQTSAIN